jgi:hypothetical protein
MADPIEHTIVLTFGKGISCHALSLCSENCPMLPF